MRAWLWCVLAIVVIAAAVVGANIQRDPAAYGLDWKMPQRKKPRKVQLVKPDRSTVVQTITAPGEIELVEQADIASQIVGQVTAVHVKKGMSVKKDTVLLELDDQDAAARLESMEARIEGVRAAIIAAQADLAKAERDAKGLEKLAERGFSTPTEIADARTTVEKMRSSLDQGRFQLREYNATKLSTEKDLERTRITAPIAGVVIDLDVEVGEIVIAGTTNLPGTVLMTIGDINHKQVRAEVDESDVSLVSRGQRARIFLQSNPDEPLSGKVDLVAPTGKKTGEVVSFETLVAIDGLQPSLRPGMTSTLEIEVRQSTDTLTLPVQAVVNRRLKELPDTQIFRDWAKQQKRAPGESQRDIESRYVPIIFVNENGVAQARPVEVGISDQDQVEIAKGLQPNEEVVAGPFRALDELKDGDPLEREEEDKAEADKPETDKPETDEPETEEADTNKADSKPESDKRADGEASDEVGDARDSEPAEKATSTAADPDPGAQP